MFIYKLTKRLGELSILLRAVLFGLVMLYEIYYSFSLSPMDTKLATCSDDGTIRTFDFIQCSEEFILRGKIDALSAPSFQACVEEVQEETVVLLC